MRALESSGQLAAALERLQSILALEPANNQARSIQSRILQARKDKSMKLPYVTRKTLKRIAKFSDTASLLEWARACGERGVICDQPAFRPKEFA